MSRTVGGRVDVTRNGVLHHAVADIEIEFADIEVETVVNTDGSIGRTVKPKAFKSPIKYRYTDGMTAQDLMSGSFDISLVLRDLNPPRSFLITDAHHEGTPKLNTQNGEIDGLSVVSSKARFV